MTKPLLNILFCDDDNQFAFSQVADLNERLAKEGITKETCAIQPLSNLNALRKIATTPKEALQWDAIFCDLGWGDLTLEGIQILHDIQMSNPHLFTILFTAQDENEFIGQALEWKFHFIDRILKVSKKGFFGKILEIILDLFYQKDKGVISTNIQILGKRILPDGLRETFVEKISPELERLQTFFSGLLHVTKEQTLAMEIGIDTEGIQLKLKNDPTRQKTFQYQELTQKVERFPAIEPHDLLPLSKAAFIEFVKQKYGGFPQMAVERGLDLNNIYRTNRRFKTSPFIVFKYDTILEMVGSYDAKEREKLIRNMLCPASIIHKTISTQRF